MTEEVEVKKDVMISTDCSLVQFTLATPEAREWVQKHVEVPSWMWVGYVAFYCEQNKADDILQGMVNDGLEVGPASPPTF